jgi:hypothetical protein
MIRLLALLLTASLTSGCMRTAPVDAAAYRQAEDAIDRALFNLHKSLGYTWHNSANDPQSVVFGNPAEQAKVQFSCARGTLSISFPARADHQSGERASLTLSDGATINSVIVQSGDGLNAFFSLPRDDPSAQSLLRDGKFRFVTRRTD